MSDPAPRGRGEGPITTWSAPVRYAEVDGQGVVFNSHYLLYCDEAMSAFCRQRGMATMAERVQLVSSTLNWKSGARWGDFLEVDVSCLKVGRTSFLLAFEITVAGRLSCHVETTYVLTDDRGRPAPIPDEARTALTA
jgi:acyl-CoA thioester hydrolase